MSENKKAENGSATTQVILSLEEETVPESVKTTDAPTEKPPAVTPPPELDKLDPADTAPETAKTEKGGQAAKPEPELSAAEGTAAEQGAGVGAPPESKEGVGPAAADSAESAPLPAEHAADESSASPVTEEAATESAPTVDDRLDALAKQMEASQDGMGAGFENLAGELAGLKKSLGFVPPKIRSVESKVMTLTDAISESKYRGLLKDLLRIHDLVDQILRGLVVVPGCGVTETHLRNYEVLRTQLLQILKLNGLEEIDASGEFDPQWHQAMGKMPTEDPNSAGRIANVRRIGFKTETTVLRYAEVDVYELVSAPPAAPAAANESSEGVQ